MSSATRRFFVIMPPRHHAVRPSYWAPNLADWTDDIHEAGQFQTVDGARAVGEEWALSSYDVVQLAEHVAE